MAIRVLIADDHNLFRQGLISLIHTREDLFEVVGEARDGLEAIRMAELYQPDVILMDIYMPQIDGLQATREIRTRFPKIAVVMLTSSESDEHLMEAVRLGASGYLLKSLDAEELFNMISGVIQGEAAMTKAMASRLLKGIARHSATFHPEEDELTEREIEVLKQVAMGKSNAEIAENLLISINTVKSHLKNILAKLQLDNRTQAAAYAVNTGLTDQSPDILKK